MSSVRERSLKNSTDVHNWENVYTIGGYTADKTRANRRDTCKYTLSAKTAEQSETKSAGNEAKLHKWNHIVMQWFFFTDIH